MVNYIKKGDNTRITKKDIEYKLNELNVLIKPYNVVHAQRYNYNALDLYRDGKLLKTIATCMTKKELYNYVNAMIEGIGLYALEPLKR